MKPSITLTLGTIAVVIDRFTKNDFPRIRPNSPQVEFSAYGTPALDGTSYELPHLWEIEAIMRPDRAESLMRLWSAWLADRTEPILIYDYTAKFHEVGTRTRELAPTASESSADGLVSYYSQFKVIPVSEFQRSQNGGWIEVGMTLQEVEKVLAA